MEYGYKQVINNRVEKRIDKIKFDVATLTLGEGYYIAGNSLNRGKPNDYDLYPVRAGGFEGVIEQATSPKLSNNYAVLSRTKNAVTIKVLSSGVILQFCNYYKPNIEQLVDSFDFAHVKLGAKITINIEDYNSYEIEGLFISPDYIEAKLQDTTFYTGSEFPLGSLMRLFKYEKRGDLVGKQYMGETIKILRDILARGYEDYNDFKDQLDAIDLNWKTDNEFKELKQFYNLVRGEEIDAETQ